MKFPDYLKINNLKKTNLVINKLISDLNKDEFAGKFVTYNNLLTTNGSIKWSENVHNDLFNILKKFNSDFRVLSSYKFQIRSLNLYSTNITPTTFNFSKLLSTTKIKNERGITVFDKINPKILEMLGVRFIVDNKPIEKRNINLVTKINHESEMIYLYEINDFTSFKKIQQKYYMLTKSVK